MDFNDQVDWEEIRWQQAEMEREAEEEYEADQSIAATLRGAALYIQRYGWSQGHLFANPTNRDEPFPPACPLGAIVAAATGSTAQPLEPLISNQDVKSAVLAFATYLVPDGLLADQDDAEEIIWRLNDRNAATADHACALLRTAANQYEPQQANTQ